LNCGRFSEDLTQLVKDTATVQTRGIGAEEREQWKAKVQQVFIKYIYNIICVYIYVKLYIKNYVYHIGAVKELCTADESGLFFNVLNRKLVFFGKCCVVEGGGGGAEGCAGGEGRTAGSTPGETPRETQDTNKV
jgi:hypothetical protein